MFEQKHDLKWFELFYDILFVVSLGIVLNFIYSSVALGVGTFEAIVESLIIMFIGFNSWINMAMLENKVKVVERDKEIKITGYVNSIFIHFFLIMLLLFSFDHPLWRNSLLQLYIKR